MKKKILALVFNNFYCIRKFKKTTHMKKKFNLIIFTKMYKFRFNNKKNLSSTNLHSVFFHIYPSCSFL